MTNLHVEWEVKDEGQATATTWAPRRKAFWYHASGRPWQRRLILCTILLVLFAGSMQVAQLVNRAERNISETEHAIALAVEADSWRRDPSGVKPHIQAIELHNDLAIVRMSAADDVTSEQDPTAVETTFYRQSATGWVRIEADGADQSRAATVEPAIESFHFQQTDHLLFQYYAADQSLVAAVAPEIESYYAALVRDVGLALPPTREKVLVKIAMLAGTSAGVSSDLADYVTWSSDGIVVLSPRLLRITGTTAQTEALRQATHVGVASYIIQLALQEYQPQAVWRDIVTGLQLWAHSPSHELHADSAGEMNSLLRRKMMDAAAPRLSMLSAAPPRLIHPEETLDTRRQQNLLPITVIDYAIATYGRGSIANLLMGLHQHDSWQSLIPAVYGVSVEEFESGWQAYLAAQYNLHDAE